MPATISVEPVTTPAQVEAFIRFPFTLYRNSPHWVPPLLSERRAFLDPRKNPVYEYAIVQPMLARRGGEVVGTIAALRNDRYCQYHPDEPNVGFFGLYEAIDDPEVSTALFEAAAAWLREQGKTVMRGPVNLTTNDVLGLLIEGFDDDPALMMPYNPPYYEAQFERFGLTKSKDLYALQVLAEMCEGTLDTVADKLIERGRCTIRSIDLSNFKAELELVRECYNQAWAANWGFVPWTDAELEFIARELKPLVDPRLTFVGYVDGNLAGISIAVPDANMGLKLAKGRLFPFGLLKLLWKVKVSGCGRLRAVALGVMPKYRRLGLDTLFVQRTIKVGVPLGYRDSEVGWILEDNESMLRPLRRLGARRTKVFRIYDRAL